MELEPSTTEFQPTDDPRPRLLPPPPVQLVAITDVTLPALAGLETQLNAFYTGFLRLEREETDQAREHLLIYRAENLRLRLVNHEVPPPRLDYRPLGMVVPSLAELELRLVEAKYEFARRRGLFAGSECLVLIDPCGNYIEVSEGRELI